MFDSMKEVMHQACNENGNTPLREIIGCISFAMLIPSLWLFLYMCGAK
nr:MAG TPA: hypothetical protein [Caudoviricetes sp.]